MAPTPRPRTGSDVVTPQPAAPPPLSMTPTFPLPSPISHTSTSPSTSTHAPSHSPSASTNPHQQPLSQSQSQPKPSTSPLPPPPPQPSSSSSPPPFRPHHSTLNAQTLPRLLDPVLSHLRDVTLIPARSPGRSIRAHRFVLAAASPVLRQSLAADPNATVLTLSHADADALDAALQYVYGCPQPIAQLPEHALWTVLTTCIAYTIAQPLSAVQSRIVACVDLHNVFYHWGMADKYKIDTIQLTCRDLVKNRFVHVVSQPQFLDIGAQRLARVLRIHDLTVSSEEDVFYALERWLAFDVDARAEQALQLLRLVRLPTMPDRTLLRVCRSPYFGGHNEFYQLLLEALIRRTEVRIVHAPRLALIERRFKRNRSSSSSTTDLAAAEASSITNQADPDKRTNVAAIVGPSNHNPSMLDKDVHGDGDSASPSILRFKPLGVSDDRLLPLTRANEFHGTTDAAPDYNRKEDRTVLFEGMFPLRWYKSVRFRPRSPDALLFTVVVPKWSTCRRRFISESRSFLNHKWSLWVDPFSSDPSRSPPRDWTFDQSVNRTLPRGTHVSTTATITSPTVAGSGESAVVSGKGSVKPVRNNDGNGGAEDMDYISIYLCCESELPASQAVDARVDFALFVASPIEEFGMERKVCVGRTFRSHGQAMGFRRHTRRSRILSTDAALYSRDKDELVVGAHVVIPPPPSPPAYPCPPRDAPTSLSRQGSQASALSHVSGASASRDVPVSSPIRAATTDSSKRKLERPRVAPPDSPASSKPA